LRMTDGSVLPTVGGTGTGGFLEAVVRAGEGSDGGDLGYGPAYG
jgi:hypothetical protein